jgi:hypothetical protein
VEVNVTGVPFCRGVLAVNDAVGAASAGDATSASSVVDAIRARMLRREVLDNGGGGPTGYVHPEVYQTAAARAP